MDVRNLVKNGVLKRIQSARWQLRPSSSPTARATISRCCAVPRTAPAADRGRRPSVRAAGSRSATSRRSDRCRSSGTAGTSPRRARRGWSWPRCSAGAGPGHGADARSQGPRPAARAARRRGDRAPPPGRRGHASARAAGACSSRSPAIRACGSCTRSAAAASCGRCGAASRAGDSAGSRSTAACSIRATVADLRERAELIVSWPVATRRGGAAARRLGRRRRHHRALRGARARLRGCGVNELCSLLGGVGDRLAGADPRLAVLALLLHVANHVLRSVAWRGVVAAAYPDRRVAVPAGPHRLRRRRRAERRRAGARRRRGQGRSGARGHPRLDGGDDRGHDVGARRPRHRDRHGADARSRAHAAPCRWTSPEASTASRPPRRSRSACSPRSGVAGVPAAAPAAGARARLRQGGAILRTPGALRARRRAAAARRLVLPRRRRAVPARRLRAARDGRRSPRW